MKKLFWITTTLCIVAITAFIGYYLLVIVPAIESEKIAIEKAKFISDKQVETAAIEKKETSDYLYTNCLLAVQDKEVRAKEIIVESNLSNEMYEYAMSELDRQKQDCERLYKK